MCCHYLCEPRTTGYGGHADLLCFSGVCHGRRDGAVFVLHVGEADAEVCHFCYDLHICVTEQSETAVNFLIYDTTRKKFKRFHQIILKLGSPDSRISCGWPVWLKRYLVAS